MIEIEKANDGYVLINQVDVKTGLEATTIEGARREAEKIVVAEARCDEPSLHTYWLDVTIQWSDDGWSNQDVLAVQIDPLPPPCGDDGQHEWEDYDWEEHESDTFPERLVSDRYTSAMRADEIETQLCECGWARHTYRNIQRPDGGDGVYDAVEYVRPGR